MKSYDELYQWSIEDVASFWAAVWDYVGIVASAPYDEVVDIRNRPSKAAAPPPRPLSTNEKSRR